MFVQEDNGDITHAARQSAAASFIARLGDGMGWKQSEWNGPMGALSDILDGNSILGRIATSSQNRFQAALGGNPNTFFAPFTQNSGIAQGPEGD
jgi:hypothetical protein